MLTVIVAHAGQPPAPHDLWSAWNLDPLLLAGLCLAVWAYRRGQAGGRPRAVDTRRARCFGAALVAVAVALISPLEALSSALASAHMVQHLLLVLAAAPLLALAAPSSTLLRGSPLAVRQTGARWRRRLRPAAGDFRAFRQPATVWLLHVGTLWFWHAAVSYGAALDNALVHVLEHVSFLLTGVLFWRVVVGARGAGRVSPGYGVLLIFAMALQSVFLSVLLTFARAPWYSGYAATTTPWGLAPLADQQLAGVIMWIPAGLVYLAAALALLVTWIRASEREEFQDLLERLRDLLEQWSVPCEYAALFGSAVRREMRPDSDIDLFVVRPDAIDGDDPRWRAQLHTLPWRVSAWTGNDTRVLEFDADEVATGLEEAEVVLLNIRSEGVRLFGPANYLRGSGESVANGCHHEMHRCHPTRTAAQS